jgi:pimeloyl-ACP methyl ester carboxylesterase
MSTENRGNPDTIHASRGPATNRHQTAGAGHRSTHLRLREQRHDIQPRAADRRPQQIPATVIANNARQPRSGARTRKDQPVLIDAAQGVLDVHDEGSGPPVVLLPSLGRAASDFDALATDLVAAGYRAVRPEPRGIGGSTPTAHQPTIADFAADVAAVVRATGDGPATVVGHAFGNRVARQTAAAHPELVDGVALLACGGLVPGDDAAMTALAAVFDRSRSAGQHLDDVRTAFFAPGHDATVWVDGWYPEVAAVQARATGVTAVDDWWAAGAAPVLVVQPAADRVAPVANAHALVDVLGARATFVTIADAGHALLPEQPHAVAAAVLDWLAAP